MIGLGYYGTHTPAVIRRNVLENPAWYTAYTPYQPEISQGRLEALLNFQTMVTDLTGLATANASMLDEGTAAAEAMTLARRAVEEQAATVYVVDADTLPQTIAVHPHPGRAARHRGAGRRPRRREPLPEEFFGLHLQYPGASGAVRDHAALVEAAHAAGALVTVAADLLALTLLRAPGEIGADIAAGTTQRFGVPMGFGGPHAGYLAVRAGLERIAARPAGRGVPGRRRRTRAYRLALQTREQHIRREKATSNICTAQVLLAVMAEHVRGLPRPGRAAGDRAGAPTTRPPRLAAGLRAGGVEVAHERVLRHRHRGRAGPGRARSWRPPRRAASTCGWSTPTGSAIACDETTTRRAPAGGAGPRSACRRSTGQSPSALPAALTRDVRDFLTHPVFSTPPLRDGDAALPAPARRPRLRAGPRHDPAGLVHDEAQRDHRDGAGQLAGVRRTSTRSPRRRRPPATRR